MARAERLLARSTRPRCTRTSSSASGSPTSARTPTRPADPGGDLKHDLRLFIAGSSRSIPPLPIEQAVEPILTLDEVSKQLNVSTKTISRWRARGLVGRRVIVNGRRQVGFPQSLVDRFLAANQERVERQPVLAA